MLNFFDFIKSFLQQNPSDQAGLDDYLKRGLIDEWEEGVPYFTAAAYFAQEIKQNNDDNETALNLLLKNGASVEYAAYGLALNENLDEENLTQKLESLVDRGATFPLIAYGVAKNKKLSIEQSNNILKKLGCDPKFVSPYLNAGDSQRTIKTPQPNTRDTFQLHYGLAQMGNFESAEKYLNQNPKSINVFACIIAGATDGEHIHILNAIKTKNPPFPFDIKHFQESDQPLRLNKQKLFFYLLMQLEHKDRINLIVCIDPRHPTAPGDFSYNIPTKACQLPDQILEQLALVSDLMKQFTVNFDTAYHYFNLIQILQTQFPDRPLSKFTSADIDQCRIPKDGDKDPRELTTEEQNMLQKIIFSKKQTALTEKIKSYAQGFRFFGHAGRAISFSKAISTSENLIKLEGLLKTQKERFENPDKGKTDSSIKHEQPVKNFDTRDEFYNMLVEFTP